MADVIASEQESVAVAAALPWTTEIRKYAVETIGAFFLVQALKTAPPLLWGPPTPVPSVIDPLHGRNFLRLCYAGGRDEMREAVERIGNWLRQI